MPTSAPAPKGQHHSELKEHQNEDTPKVESADRKERGSQAQQERAAPAPFININGDNNVVTLIIGSNLQGSSPAKPPPNELKRRMRKRAMSVIWQAVMWVIRFHGHLQTTAPVILEILGDILMRL